MRLNTPQFTRHVLTAAETRDRVSLGDQETDEASQWHWHSTNSLWDPVFSFSAAFKSWQP